MIRRLVLALALVVAGGLVGSPQARAGGATYCVNCSSWMTQLSQQIEQVHTALNTAQTVRNGLQQVLYLGQTLQQMDPSALAGMTGRSLQEVQAMTRMYGQVSGLINGYSTLNGRLEEFQQAAASNNMTPQQYLQYQAQLAQSKGAAYRASYDEDQRLIQSLNSQASALSQTAAQVPTVTSQVGGLQQLLAQNVGIQQQLVTMNAQMAKANALASQEQLEKASNKHAVDAAAAQSSVDYERVRGAAGDAYKLYDPKGYSLTDPVPQDSDAGQGGPNGG